MQATWLIQLLGWVLLILGIVFVVIALSSAIHRTEQKEAEQTESKGFILIGPIPIVWGFGTKGWLIAGLVFVVLVIIWLVSMT
jgi:uncharacterized protein (TIGR00304 family)